MTGFNAAGLAPTVHRLGVLMLGLLCIAGLPVASAASAAELVMFDQANCSWCRRWDREVGVGYGASDEGRQAPLRRIDISQAATSGIQLARRVTSTPTFVLAEDGVEMGRITGYPGADFFWGQLGDLLARRAPPAVPATPELERRAFLAVP